MACDPNSFVRAPGTGALLEASAGQHHPARGKEDRYGQDKLFLERALRAAPAPEWVALRLPDVLGPHENTGELRIEGLNPRIDRPAARLERGAWR
eukprot:scaffold28543_cov101-Isochrysis_galbana.AAC.1